MRDIVSNYEARKARESKEKEQKKKSYFSNFIVVLVVVLNFWFTDRLLDIYAITQTEPVALIAAWFGFTTGELWFLVKIKMKKIQ